MSQSKVQLVSNIVGNVSGGASFTGIVTASNFVGNLTGTASNATTAGSVTYAPIAGIATNAQGLTGSPSISVTNINATGVITATSFIDDGTNLLTEINTKTSTGKAIAMAMIFG